MARSCRLALRRAHAIWVRNNNGTSGRAGVQNSSLSWDWNLEKPIATGTHNSEPLGGGCQELAAGVKWTRRAPKSSLHASVGFALPMALGRGSRVSQRFCRQAFAIIFPDID